MAASKECVIIIVDIGRSMCADPVRKRDVAIKAVSQIIQQKLVYSSAKRDEMNIILSGTTESANSMFLSGSESYAHIKDLYGKYVKPTVAMLKYIQEEPISNENGDILSAVLLALSSLVQTPGYKKGQGRIVLFSDLETPIEGEEQTDFVIDACREYGIQLQIIVFETLSPPPFPSTTITTTTPILSSSSSSSSSRSSVHSTVHGEADNNHDDNDNLVSASAHRHLKRLHHTTMDTTTTTTHDNHEKSVDNTNDITKVNDHTEEIASIKKHNIGLFEIVVNSIRDAVGEAHIMHASHALEIISDAKTRAVRNVTKFRGTLNVGNSIKIPVWTYAHSVEAKLPTLKKTTQASAVAALTKAQGGNVSGSHVEDDEGTVSYKREYVQPDMETKEVNPSQLVKAFRYGRDLIPVTKVDEEAVLKYPTERQLAVLGVQNANILPRYAYLGAVDIVVAAQPDKEVMASSKALSAFARGLANQNCVAICRYVKRANSIPLLVAAIPALADVSFFTPPHQGTTTTDEDIPIDTDEKATQITGNPADVENILRQRERFRGTGSVLEGHHTSTKVPRRPLPVALSSRVTGAPSGSGEIVSPDDDEDIVVNPSLHKPNKTTTLSSSSSSSSSSSTIGYTELPSQKVFENDDINGPAYEHPPLISPFPFDVLYLVPIPYLDDVRAFAFDNPFTIQDRFIPTEDQLEAMDNYIDGMDLMTAAAAENQMNGFMHQIEYGGFNPRLSFNPLMHRFYNAVMARMLNPQAPLPPIDADIQAYTTPVYNRQASVKQSNAGIDALYDAFGGTLSVRDNISILGENRSLDRRMLTGTKRSSDALKDTATGLVNNTNGNDDEGIPSKRSRAGTDSRPLPSFFGIDPSSMGGSNTSTTTTSSSSSSSTIGRNITAIGTAHPVDDFHTLISKRDPKSIESAISGMMKVIQTLGKDPLHVPKAVQALQTLRDGTMKLVEEERFNSYLRLIKSGNAQGTNRTTDTPLWREIVSKGVTLISNAEASTSVTPAEAQTFLLPYSSSDTATTVASSLVDTQEDIPEEEAVELE